MPPHSPLVNRVQGPTFRQAPDHHIETTTWAIEICFYTCSALILGSALFACTFHLENKLSLLWILYLAAIPADLVSGFLHWVFDSYAPAKDTSWFAKPFRAFAIHHDDPALITQHDPHAVDYETLAITTSIIVVLGFNGTLIWESPFWALACVAGGFTNRFHRWAHMPEPPLIAKQLQSLRLIVSAKDHGKHHVAPYRQSYCISSGLLTNPVLDHLGFWESLESVVYKWTGRETKQESFGDPENPKPSIRPPQRLGTKRLAPQSGFNHPG